MQNSRDNVPPLLLRASTKRPLGFLLPLLRRDLSLAGSFIRHQSAPSGRTVSICIELHRDSSGDIYAGMLASGLDLHRDAHTALASLCASANRPRRRGSSNHIEIQLDIRSLDPRHRDFFLPTLVISA